MKSRIRILTPVVEAGDYDEFKRCADELLVLPVLGSNYRLYSDDFNNVWYLVEVCAPLRPVRPVRWAAPYARVLSDNNNWYFGFCKREITSPVYFWSVNTGLPRSTSASSAFLSNFDNYFEGACTYVECRTGETWEDQVAGGYIVPEGNDVPHGSVRDDCIRRGVAYVVSRDMEALARFMALTRKSWNADEIKDYDPVRISRSSPKSDRYAVYARSLNRRLGKVTHQQHPQKKPGR